MEEKNSIEVLEELSAGMFCNIELPLTKSMKIYNYRNLPTTISMSLYQKY